MMIEVPDWYPFTNFIVFSKVLEGNPELCQELLSVVLERDIGPLKITRERKLTAIVESKEVQLDVYAEDGEAIFDIEMQVRQVDGFEKRTRYYQGMLDVAHLGKGESYKTLPPTVIIFICCFDKYGENKPKYWMKLTDQENMNIRMENDAPILVVAATKEVVRRMREELQLEEALRGTYGAGSNNGQDAYAKKLEAFRRKERLANFIDYLVNGVLMDDFTERLHDAVIFMNQSIEGRHRMYSFSMYLEDVASTEKRIGREEGRQEGRQEGRREGRQEGQRSLLRSLFLNGNISAEVGARELGTSIDEFVKLMNEESLEPAMNE